MAEFTGITADRAEEILGMSVVSGIVNEFGQLIFTRHNGSTFNGGDFMGIMTDIMDTSVDAQIAATLPNAIAGTVVNKGNVAGALTLPELNSSTIVNAMVKLVMTGNVTFNITALPSTPKTNSQFVMRLQQDGVGNRTFTLTGFKKSLGSVPITVTANAVDLVVFIYDGANWLVGLMGADFK